MRRAILMVAAVMCLQSTNALADNFIFSFTGGAGTVTGEIFGLQNNMTAPATEVLITSYPAPLGPIIDPDATHWAVQIINLFTEENGTITDADFEAFDPVGSHPELFLDAPSSPASFLLVPGNGVEGHASYTLASLPEPSPWILFLTVMLTVAIVKRSRRTDGLDDPATRMRS